MFIGREKELATLNGLYNSDKFEFAVIYGRRRVGKTALISHFIQDKKAIYFMGVESNEKQNLENFSQAIMLRQPCRKGIYEYLFFFPSLKRVKAHLSRGF